MTITTSALLAVAGCGHFKKKAPPYDDKIVVDFADKRVTSKEYDFTVSAIDRQQWLSGVAAISLGLSAPQAQLTTHPAVGDGLPVECDTPRALLTALIDQFSRTPSCRGQLEDLALGPFAILQCDLPRPEGSIECPSFYRAFVWGEIESDVPPVSGPKGDRVAFTVESLAFVSSTCARGGANFHHSNLDPSVQAQLEGTGSGIRAFFSRCQKPDAAPYPLDGGTK